LDPAQARSEGKNFQILFEFFSINGDNNSEIWRENWPGPHFTMKTEQMAGRDFDLSQTELSHEDLPRHRLLSRICSLPWA
jgi:hypothetical protein